MRRTPYTVITATKWASRACFAGNQIAEDKFFPSLRYPRLSLQDPEQVTQDAHFARRV
jgi:hypothetical protein